MNALLRDWQARIETAAAAKKPLRIRGGGSKDFYGGALNGDIFDTRSYTGIVDYDPAELVVTARCGTPLAQVESTLRDGGQLLAFEPPHFQSEPATVGGAIAAGLSGPRRPYAGAVRDLVLGVRVLDGTGQDLSFGGRVMKNVAGFDASRLMAGALGTLGVIVEASIKCVPQPQAETTRVFELLASDAIERLNRWGAKPFPISASCWHRGVMRLRLSGAKSAVAGAVRTLGGEELSEGGAFWQSIRDQTHSFFEDPPSPLWRLSVKSTAPCAAWDNDALIEWGGALRWVKRAVSDAATLREWAVGEGGHATLFRGSVERDQVFQALPAVTLDLHRRLKSAFDPAGILNPGRLYPGL